MTLGYCCRGCDFGRPCVHTRRVEDNVYARSHMSRDEQLAWFREANEQLWWRGFLQLWYDLSIVVLGSAMPVEIIPPEKLCNECQRPLMNDGTCYLCSASEST